MQTTQVNVTVTKSIDSVNDNVIKQMAQARGLDNIDPTRVLRFVASTETPDRAGDIINKNGWVLDNFQKNPVFLWAHNSQEPPVGVSINETVTERGLEMDIYFTDVTEKARDIFKLYETGVLKAVSVGFRPLEIKQLTDAEKLELGLGPFGAFFDKAELLELSGVSVPCNPDALIAKDFDNPIFERLVKSSLESLKIEEQVYKKVSSIAEALERVEKALDKIEQVVNLIDQKQVMAGTAALADLLDVFEEGKKDA